MAITYEGKKFENLVEGLLWSSVSEDISTDSKTQSFKNTEDLQKS